MQIKTMLRFHLTPIKMATITNAKLKKARMLLRILGQRNPLTLLVGMQTSPTATEIRMEIERIL